jgi:competence protein ComEC
MSVGLQIGATVVAGVAVGVLTAGIFALAVALTIGLAAVAIAWPRRSLAVVAIGCAAVVVGADARRDALRPLPATWSTGDTVRLVGILESDAALTPTGVRIDLRVDGRRVRATVAGTMASGEYARWTRGRTLIAPMRLRRPDVVRNPGSPTLIWQALTRRFDALATVKSALLVEVAPGPWWQEAAARVRAHVRRVTATWLAPRAQSSQAVVTAILIGDRAGLDDEVTRRLQAAGTFHVIAISGGNIAMLTVACFLALRLVSRGLIGPVVTTIGVVSTYGLIVGGDPSVIRAVVAAVVYLLLRLWGIPPRPINLLAVVAVLCVVWDPLTVLDVGAWLSFGATAGLIVVLPRLIEAARGDGVPAGRWARARDVCRAACLATVAAEVVILPITAGVFARVGVAGVLLNLIAIPAMAVVQLSGLVLCVVALVSTPAAEVAALVAHQATVVLLGSSKALDLAPWLSWRVPPMSIWWTVAYYGAIVCALRLRRPRPRRLAVVAATTLAAVLMSSPFVALRRPAPGWLRISVLDVGQGESILVQTPDRTAVLVDAGGTPSGTFDVGGRVVAPAVWALGERRIDWLALTHGDLDHVGGARRILDDLRPREVLEGIPVESDQPLQQLRALAGVRRIAWRRLRVGHEVELGAVHLVVRHPPRPDWQRVRVRNDDSLVLEVRYGEVAFLLTGDAGAEFESLPIEPPLAGGRPRIRILKVGHHGSQTSTSAEWLEQFDPRVALISAGASNLFGHPAPAVLARLGARGVHVFRTDRHGAVIVETDGREVRVRAMSGARLDVS